MLEVYICNKEPQTHRLLASDKSEVYICNKEPQTHRLLASDMSEVYICNKEPQTQRLLASDMSEVYVFNTSSNAAGFQGRFSGRSLPGPFHSTNGRFHIRFTTDPLQQFKGWSATFSYDCPSVLPLPQHATVDSDLPVPYGDSVVYGCRDGYHLKGVVKRVCGSRGKWLSAPPSCIPVRCAVPTNAMVTHGIKLKHTGLEFGAVVTFKCMMGYRLLMRSTTVCGLCSGVPCWFPLPHCSLVTCPVVSSPTHGSISLTSVQLVLGTQVRFSCDTGFHLDGDKVLFCTEHGNWSAPLPTCTAVTCTVPATILHGSVRDVNPVGAGAEVTVTCDAGYGHTYSVKCLDAGHWNDSLDCTDVDECQTNVCLKHTCVNLPGDYRCDCLPGYASPDKSLHTCKDIDECSLGTSGCEKICNNTEGGYMCSCPTGYNLFEGKHATLVANHSCVPVLCPAVMVTHGSVFGSTSPQTGGHYTFGSRLDIVCDYGYMTNNSQQVECLSSGRWSAAIPQCTSAQCEEIGRLSHGTVQLSTSLSLGSVARYNCDIGYTLLGSSVRECMAYRPDAVFLYRWSGMAPTCKPVQCDPPTVPENGYIEGNDTSFGATVMVFCRPGHDLLGARTRTCSADRLWKPDGAICRATPGCETLTDPAHGMMVERPDKFPVHSLVQFQCTKPGYKLSGFKPGLNVECFYQRCHCAPQSGQTGHRGVDTEQARDIPCDNSKSTFNKTINNGTDNSKTINNGTDNSKTFNNDTDNSKTINNRTNNSCCGNHCTEHNHYEGSGGT
ncbi:hypothetical protein NP493_468g02011 [Ridgeia piscesae]|uniref:Uncharacterized protein n=1 Tax=Ridgeia piscesae TaxID=27915 RepID=A0AAD9NRB4_RIDPI|nr:hypothetical protein NP493_468g02011 [Ridgeia piscesae]